MIYEKILLKDKFPFLGENGKNPTLEVYLPYNMTEMNRQNQKRPCMVICPGGGYGMCSQRESEPIALRYLAKGFNVFLLTYSVAPNRFPSQLREVAAVMEIIYDNAENYNCDTAKIAIIGFSAGGHLAAHYSTMYDCKEVREVFPESKPVNASVLCYPVITSDPEIAHLGSFENLLGHLPQNDFEKEYFSCDLLVKENTPPAFIWHTAEDNCVPVENSFIYSAALSKYKIPFELHIYPFGCHGLSTCDNETVDNVTENIAYCSNWIEDSVKWLKLIFKI